ncbi:MAG: hypothetical protein AAF288_14220 [Planctomycetota bacterium]
MLAFRVFDDAGAPAEDWPIRNAHALGSDGNAMRARIAFSAGHIVVDRRDPGPCAVALQHDLGELGSVTLQTCLLPDRDEPYVLELELARHRLMTLLAKLEDWLLFELSHEHPVQQHADRGRELFIEALGVQKRDPAQAAALGGEALREAFDGSEALALAHSATLLQRRASGVSPGAPPPVGCGLSLGATDPRVRHAIKSHFDYCAIPTPWRVISPAEGQRQWGALDGWVQWARRVNLPVVAGPVLSFEPGQAPDWLYIWEHDYDTVRDLVYEHVEALVRRLGGGVGSWVVASGLHINEHFVLTFEQLMDLTRMVTMLVKKLQPAAKVVVELKRCFGEYFGRNPRSIPPAMYADLLVQSGIHYDVLGLSIPMGQPVDGQYTRDLMQLSTTLDQYGQYGKPLAVSLSAPSRPVTSIMVAAPGDEPAPEDSGRWRRTWSPAVQGHWLEAAMQIAMSKPFVESVSWREIVDHPDIELPLSGLVDEDLCPKPAWRRLVSYRQHVAADVAAGANSAATAPAPAPGGSA